MTLCFILLFSVAAFWSCKFCESLVAFDCSHPGINVTTIGIEDVPGCNVIDPVNEPTTTEIQLVQLADSYPLKVLQCKVIIQRQITHCGMHNHASTVRGGYMEYLRPISRSECQDLHRDHQLRIGDVIITDLVSNTSSSHAVVFAGKVSYDGQCQGTGYADSFGSWDSVVVQGVVTIMLTDYSADADTSSDTIRLRSGVTCKTSSGGCMDIENGYTTWVHDQITSCDKRKHIVLFQGGAQVYKEKETDGTTSTTYIVETKEKVFGLRTLRSYRGCMFEAFVTEHPKLIIVPKGNVPFFLEESPPQPSSLDIMAYINTKFVYVERVRAANERDMYNQLSIQRCALERKTLQTLLSIAAIDPPEFAYTYMSSPGYTAVQMGEVVHLISCVPVEVSLRKSSQCYKEMPIVYRNRSMYATPRSRLLQEYGTEVDCDSVITPQFRLENQWYAVGEFTHTVPDPILLAPEPIKIWKKTSYTHLATAGIYSYDESEKLRSRLMNPYERDAVNNIIVRGVTGNSYERQGISLTSLSDESLVDSMADQIGKKVWGVFSVVGNVTSGLLGIYFMCRILKFLADTVIHCHILYGVYGFSVALLAGVWDSVTTYMIHRRTKSENTTIHTEELESLQEVVDKPASAPDLSSYEHTMVRDHDRDQNPKSRTPTQPSLYPILSQGLSYIPRNPLSNA